jgi:hypothetical protein
MAKIELSQFLGGISFSDRLGREGSYFIGRAANPTNPLYEGYLTAGPAPILVSTTPTDVSAMVENQINIANEVYFIDKTADAKIHKYNIGSGNLSSSGVWPHTIYSTGSTRGEDVKIYPVGTTPYLFYSYNGYSTTQGQVGRYDLSSTFDDDFLAKEPTGANSIQDEYPHPMLEWGTSGYLYIADGRYLHQFDGQTGANGTFTHRKFALPFGYIITSLFDAEGFIGMTAVYYPKALTIGASWSIDYAQGSAVFFWDGVSNSFNKKVPVEDKVLVASQSIAGEYRVFGKNWLNQGTIRKWNGNSFELVEIIRSNVAYGTGPNRFDRYPTSFGMVSKYKNMSLISADLGNAGYGDVFLYGSPKPGISSALYHIAIADTSSAASPAAFGHGIAACSGSIILMSMGNSSGNFFKRFAFDTADNDYFQYKSLYYEFPQRARINYVKCHFQTLASGQGDDVLLDLDYGKNQIHAGNISYAKDGAITEKKLGVNRECDNFRVVIQKDEGAGIKYGKIVINYDLLEGDIK